MESSYPEYRHSPTVYITDTYSEEEITVIVVSCSRHLSIAHSTRGLGVRGIGIVDKVDRQFRRHVWPTSWCGSARGCCGGVLTWAQSIHVEEEP